MKSPLVRRIATLGLAGTALVSLTAGTGAQAFAAENGSTTPAQATAFPALNPAALQAAIETRPTDGASGAIARIGEPGQLWKGSTPRPTSTTSSAICSRAACCPPGS
ncbi:hypothetical protein [Streptantibioticus ferralitis]|uniref:Uncharacterized protein n=1 Tax=Streptantibioticus ferralitis TaxID=236510 RepID=A0ABT5YUJ8_9ACTN|nr:hypothetical protein [Streptantibioticus ferralitis]MDF2255224.1 hypothetical protein [Streptantibioticus ferralitis]